MPICADPESTVAVSLDADKAKDEAARPAFLFRFPTCRELTKIKGLLAQATEAMANDDVSCVGLLEQSIAVTLAGWRNVKLRGAPMAFGQNAPSEFLTLGELWSLAYLAISATQLAEGDRKNSESRRDCEQASTAPDASPAAA